MSLILDAREDLAEDWAVSPSGLVLPGEYVRPQPIAIDLFAGCGGFSLGFEQAGFQVIGALEMDFDAAHTYMVNLARPGVRIHFDTAEREAGFAAYLEKALGFKGQGNRLTEGAMFAGDGWISGQPDHVRGCEHFWIADVRTVRGEDILQALGRKRGEIDAVIGGPPCQGFSQAGRRNVMDPRNTLVFDFVRLVLELRPKTMVMENVPAMLSMVTPEGVPVVDAICEALEDGGFGKYEALKRALTGLPPTARHAARAASKRRRKAPDGAPEPAAQAELFE